MDSMNLIVSFYCAATTLLNNIQHSKVIKTCILLNMDKKNNKNNKKNAKFSQTLTGKEGALIHLTFVWGKENTFKRARLSFLE